MPISLNLILHSLSIFHFRYSSLDIETYRYSLIPNWYKKNISTLKVFNTDISQTGAYLLQSIYHYSTILPKPIPYNPIPIYPITNRIFTFRCFSTRSRNGREILTVRSWYWAEIQDLQLLTAVKVGRIRKGKVLPKGFRNKKKYIY